MKVRLQKISVIILLERKCPAFPSSYSSRQLSRGKTVYCPHRHTARSKTTQSYPKISQKTCHRSKVLVERMRTSSANCSTNSNSSISSRDCGTLTTSERLYEAALEQQRRHRIREAEVAAATRRRATPDLAANHTSKLLVPSHRSGDIGERLYEQAVMSRELAMEREHIAQRLPRGATFHPEISRRSASLARRRRRESFIDGGSDESSSSGVVVVEEGLLAEGRTYRKRREEREMRQEEMAVSLGCGYRANLHSEKILREADQKIEIDTHMAGFAPEKREDGLENVRTGGGAHDASSYGDDGFEEATFVPEFQAMKTSKRLLESR